jgi:hypothetical protein
MPIYCARVGRSKHAAELFRRMFPHVATAQNDTTTAVEAKANYMVPEQQIQKDL